MKLSLLKIKTRNQKQKGYYRRKQYDNEVQRCNQ